MVKDKSTEMADFVVGGYRGAPGDPACLLLGAYDGGGVLRHVGQTTVLPARQRAEVATVLAPLEGQRSFPEVPGFRRWTSHRFEEWVSVAAELVREVAYARMAPGLPPPRRALPAVESAATATLAPRAGW
jgi:ATP-dependent DNA ligase